MHGDQDVKGHCRAIEKGYQVKCVEMGGRECERGACHDDPWASGVLGHWSGVEESAWLFENNHLDLGGIPWYTFDVLWVTTSTMPVG